MKSPRLDPDDVLTPNPQAQIAEVQIAEPQEKRLLLRHAGGVSMLHGVRRWEIEAVLAEIDGERSAGEIAAALEESLGERRAVTLLRRLADDVLGRRPRRPGRVVLLGGGPGCRLLESDLRAAGFEDVLAIAHSSAPLAPAKLWVIVLEEASYAEILEAQERALEKGVTCLFLTADGDGLRVGPTVVAGHGACFGCAQLAALGFLNTPPEATLATAAGLVSGALISAERRFGPAARRTAVAEIGRILSPGDAPRLVGRVALFGLEEPRLHAFEARPDCPICTAGTGGVAPRREDVAQAAWPLVEALERRPPTAFSAADDGLVTTVGILGGGTAGYLTALALRARRPELAVTVIESSALPVIGVGEATTPLLPQFLHADLGLDVERLFAEVQPTFKLGVRFAWGGLRQNPGGAFNYPFGPLTTLETLHYDGALASTSLRGELMTAGRLPLYRGAAGAILPRFDTETAYHLENRRFAAFLRREAEAAGVERVEATIADVELAPAAASQEGAPEVRALLAEDGRRFTFDLYVDASGFRSRLIEKALGSPFLDYRASLPTDAAIVGAVERQGRGKKMHGPAPYTLAETMNAGWCWSTPQREADHRGYVFASSHLSPERAEAEMRRANPGLGEARLVRFRSGRHAHFWKANVVALGNAYGFVEPLESTALHMLVRQVGLLTSAFPLRRAERGLGEIYNREVGEAWDYLRFFLAVHYKFNRRKRTSFWRACRAEIDLGEHAEWLEIYAERGPLAYDMAARRHFAPADPLWGPPGLDLLLLGQGVVPRRPPWPRLGAAAWRRLVAQRRQLAALALPQKEALELLDHRPELLERLARTWREAGPAYA